LPVPFDREDTLKKAEEFLHLGRLDQAIAEYQRVVDEIPNDWKTLNALADLYLRADQPERATSLFARIADHLAVEGFDARAQAFYKRILKVTPDDERALEALAGVALRQGILVEAKSHLVALSRVRQARGDARGAAEALLRVNTLDPADLSARREAARSAAASGNTDFAATELLAIAAELAADDNHREALDVLQDAMAIVPHDATVRERLFESAVGARLFEPLKRSLSTAADCLALADRLTAAGWSDGAVMALDEAVRLSPESADARARAARVPREHDERARALDDLSAPKQVDDPGLQTMALDSALRSGRREEALQRLGTLLDQRRISDQDVAVLIHRYAVSDRDTTWPALELFADRLADRGNASEAARQLRGFCDTHPDHIAALMKLVEMLGDVGGEAELIDAQARLAEAYLQAGSGAEARIVAEDLVSRAPADPAYRDCLRRVLALAGEPDPEKAVTEFARQAATFSASPGPDMPEEPSLPPATGDPAARRLFELSAAAIDLGGILDEREVNELAGQAARDSEAPEIDLTEVLRELMPRPSHAVGSKKGLRMSDQPERSNLDDVFRDFRDEVSRQTAADAAEQHYKVALTYRDMGMLDDAMRELELAAREPRLRFEAASSLARLVRDRGDVPSAIDWFERAAEAPAPTPEAGRALLYELGQALESCGEVARALAVYLELQADAGDYADLKSRIERLSRVQTES
jgi:tetratricopeptide (TPR) repeat protein